MAGPKRTDENVRIGADTTQAEKGFKKLLANGKAMVGLLAAAAVAALTKVGQASLEIFREQEQAEIRLRRALVATGQYTAEYEKRLHDLANRIQATTTVGDEQAMGVIQNLVTVGKVGADQIDGAATMLIGLANHGGRSVERMARTVSKGLTDIADENKASIGELERYLSSAEITMLRTMKETTGGVAAQTKAIEILSGRYSRFANSVEGSTDVYEQMKNTAGDVVEEIGRFLHLVTGPLAAKARDFFAGLDKDLEGAYVWIRSLPAQWELMTAKLNLAAARGNKPAQWVLDIKTAWDELGEAVDESIGFIESVEKRWWRVLWNLAGVDEAKKNHVKNLADEKQETEEVRKAIGAVADAEKNLAAVRNKIRQDMIGGGAGTDGGKIPTGGGGTGDLEGQLKADEARARQTEAAKDRIALARQTLMGVADIEREHNAAMLRLISEREEAEKLLRGEKTRALGEARLEAIALEIQIEQEAYDRKREAARQAFDADIEAAWERTNRELDQMRAARELERELGRELDAEDMEYLRENLQTEEDLKREYRDRELQEAIEARRQRIEDERIFGKELARVKNAFDKKSIDATRGLFSTLQSISEAGGKKQNAMAKAFAKAQLLLDLATKPFEAYAKTSAAYPIPLGPALGAVHAALVVAQIGMGLAKVGGGGGGGGVAPSASVPAIGSSARYPGVDYDDIRERDDEVIHLRVDLDGETIAQLVQRRLAYAENE